MHEASRVVVERPTINSPWGFRLSGGLDCNQPLSVAQVRKRSSADRAGLKIGDFVLALDGIPTDRLTHRQVLDLIGSQRVSLTFDLARSPHPGSAMSSSSSAAAAFGNKDLAVHGLLAYIPAVSHTQNTPSVASDPYPGRSYAKPSYRAPPFKQQEARTIKSYQPFDMTGDSLYHGGPPKTKLFYFTQPPPTSPPQTDSTIQSVPFSTPPATTYRTPPPAASPPDSSFYNPLAPKAPAPWSPPPQSDYGLSYNQTVASPASHSVPTYTAAAVVPAARPSYDDDVASRPSVLKPAGGVTQDKSFWSTRKSYYNDADEPRACAQSRTFYILEAMLSEQGSGEQGLPPPPVHSGSHAEESPATVGSTPVVIGIHPGARPAPVSTATATANISLRQQAPATDFELHKTAVRMMPATRPPPALPHEETVTKIQPNPAELPNTTTTSAPKPDLPAQTAAPKPEAQPEASHSESKLPAGDLIDLGSSDSAPASSGPADGGPAATAATATENKALAE